MERVGTQTLVDEGGNPLDPRIQQVLQQLLPKLRARFPRLSDDVLATEVLETAGRRIQAHERAGGPVQNLEAYAWVVASNTARSRLRRGAMRLVRATLPGEESETVLEAISSKFGTAEQIESDILHRELMARLPTDERLLCLLKKMGFSSREIADELHTTVAHVDTLFYRIKRKIRAALQEPGTADSGSSNSEPPKRTA
jgi:RNA polymerase sigma factor (sigma-70 family)